MPKKACPRRWTTLNGDVCREFLSPKNKRKRSMLSRANLVFQKEGSDFDWDAGPLGEGGLVEDLCSEGSATNGP